MSVLNFKQVDVQLKKLEGLPEQELDKIKRAVAFDAFGELSTRTPVDTGAARASWNMSSGKPVFVSTPRPEGGATLPPPVPALVAASSDQPFTPIFITNGQVYIVPLDDGHSQKQAPAGMTSGMLNFLRAKYNAK